MRHLPRSSALRFFGFNLSFIIASIGITTWLALYLQAGSSGVYLFLMHDVFTKPERAIFLLGFILSFVSMFTATFFALRLPRFDFFNRIVAINIVVYSVFGLLLSALRVPLISREVFVAEFFLSIILFLSYYLLRNRICPCHIGVLDHKAISSFASHPALYATKVDSSTALSQNFAAVIADLRGDLTPEDARLFANLTQRKTPVIDTDHFIERLWGRIPASRLTATDVETFTPPLVYQRIKRVSELAVIILFAPLLVIIASIIAVAIRIESPGPALFRQSRTGLKGARFTMLKFRSMITGADTDTESRFAEKNDRRITKVGRFLRRVRLDELPQLWNILRGEMSLIGPRPEQEGFTRRFDQLIPFYSFRHNIPPGITGWAQVMHGYADSEAQTRTKLEFDLYYIKHMSAWLDLVILFKTVRTIFFGSGAR